MPVSSRSVPNDAPSWACVVAVFALLALLPSTSLAQQRFASESAQQEKDGESGVDYSWSDGATTIRFDNGELKLANRVQFRGTDRRSEPASAEREFDIPRARTEFSGWAFVEHFTYEVQFDWADGPELQDLYFGVDVSRTGKFVVNVGQFKVPSSRQRVTSSGELQFVDRSIVAGEFTTARDIGVEVSGDLASDRLEYRLGVFGGAGPNTLVKNGGLQYNGRVTYQPLGTVEYSESDVESKGVPLVAIGGYAEVHDRPQMDTAGDRIVVGGDAVLFYRGLSLLGELYLRTFGDVHDAPLRSSGFLLQGGYFVIPQRLEIAGRLATWDRQAWSPAGADREIGIAFGYFLNRHNLKLQADWRRLDEPHREGAAHEFRTQLQLMF